jgi:hypothetical protein
MRIYSNTVLSWPQVIHVFQIARLYPGRWQNYYFYKINRVQPYILNTNSPLELLQENCKYYCYEKYTRDKHLEEFGNRFEILSVPNKGSEVGSKTWGYIPKVACANDIIVVQNDTAAGYPSVNWPTSLSMAPLIALQ